MRSGRGKVTFDVEGVVRRRRGSTGISALSLGSVAFCAPFVGSADASSRPDCSSDHAHDGSRSRDRGGGAIRPQIIRDHPIGNEAIFLQKFSHQFQRSMLISLGLDQHIEDFALGVDGAPQMDHSAGDFQIDFIQMPYRLRLGAALTQVRCDHRPEMIYPASDCFIGDRNPAFRQQIFDIAKAQGEPEIKPDRLLNDLGRISVSVVADFLNRCGYRTAERTATPNCRDNALSSSPF